MKHFTYSTQTKEQLRQELAARYGVQYVDALVRLQMTLTKIEAPLIVKKAGKRLANVEQAIRLFDLAAEAFPLAIPHDAKTLYDYISGWEVLERIDQEAFGKLLYHEDKEMIKQAKYDWAYLRSTKSWTKLAAAYPSLYELIKKQAKALNNLNELINKA